LVHFTKASSICGSVEENHGLPGVLSSRSTLYFIENELKSSKNIITGPAWQKCYILKMESTGYAMGSLAHAGRSTDGSSSFRAFFASWTGSLPRGPATPTALDGFSVSIHSEVQS
jgi:hypothetical protein